MNRQSQHLLSRACVYYCMEERRYYLQQHLQNEDLSDLSRSHPRVYDVLKGKGNIVLIQRLTQEELARMQHDGLLDKDAVSNKDWSEVISTGSAALLHQDGKKFYMPEDEPAGGKSSSFSIYQSRTDGDYYYSCRIPGEVDMVPTTSLIKDEEPAASRTTAYSTADARTAHRQPSAFSDISQLPLESANTSRKTTTLNRDSHVSNQKPSIMDTSHNDAVRGRDSRISNQKPSVVDMGKKDTMNKPAGDTYWSPIRNCMFYTSEAKIDDLPAHIKEEIQELAKRDYRI